MDIELHLEQLAVDLDFAARRARKRMQKENRGLLSTFADEGQHRIWLHALLREMATVIDDTARGNARGERNRRLYVWPGYDSVILEMSRVTFQVDRDTRVQLQTLGYENGLAADGGERELQTGLMFPSVEKQTDRVTLYFDAALSGTEATFDADNTFSVGSTHNWLAASPTIGTDPLIGFEVRTTPAASDGHRSFPTIVLDPAGPLEWGDAIATAINSACEDSPASFWPLPVRRPKERSEVYGQRLAEEHGSRHHRSIRHRLYSLWLIGCFTPDPGAILLEAKGQRWLERLCRDLDDVEPERARRVRGLIELERNLASGSIDIQLAPTQLVNWGVLTIPFPIANTRAGDTDEADDLGSGMLLSNFDIPTWYYFAIRQWISSYYLSLRQQESSVALAEREADKAAIQAQRELRRQLSHAVGTELTYVEYLANVARESIAADNFVPSKGRLAAGVEYATRCGPGVDFDTEFHNRHGVPSALEKRLIEGIVQTDASGRLTRDISLMQSALAAVPIDEGRLVLAALLDEVGRIALENRALVRVDDPAVVAELDDGCEGRGETQLVDILGHALAVALTVYFRKAFPPYLEAPEDVCRQSAEALFGRDNLECDQRLEGGRDCAIQWRDFLARSYRTRKEPPSYSSTVAWLNEKLPRYARFRMDLPKPSDKTRLASGCGDQVPLVLQAWFTEAVVNALKHTRPSSETESAVIRIAWQRRMPIIKVSNTTTQEKAQEAIAVAEAANRGASALKEGHQGLPFLSYAVRHLFRGYHLHAELDRSTQLLHLYVS